MTAKKVIFISSSSYGHLIKTSLIAKYYIKQGAQVHYFVNGDNLHFFKHHPFPYTVFSSKPFAAGKEITGKNNFMASIKLWCSFIVSQLKSKNLEERKGEIESILLQQKPDIVFLDEFSVTDFAFISPFLDKFRLIITTPFFPSRENKMIPPLNAFAFPENNAEGLWKGERESLAVNRLKRKLLFLFLDHVSQTKKVFKKLNVDPKYKPDFSWENVPNFPNVEKWYLQPYELDFVKQDLPSYQMYMGPMMDLNRTEIIDTRYNMFLKLSSANSIRKIVFCSLGSVITNLVNDENVLIRFYNTIAEVAAQNLHCFYAVKIPPTLKGKVKPLSVNFFVFFDIPYLNILKKADLFITHCGGNSYLESIYMKTPMLAVPPVNKWDYNGNASRVVYHELGLKANLSSSVEEFNSKINALLADEKYAKNVSKMSEFLREKYHSDYLNEQMMP